MEEKLRQWLQSRFAGSVVSESVFRGQVSFYLRPEELVPICQALLEDSELEVRFLADITSCDWLGHEASMGGRFEVIYNLCSLTHNFRFFFKVMLPAENPQIASLTPLWNGANWLEREVWDMMGVRFSGHPNLTKILTPDELEGFPLRKDFPLTYEVPQFTWNKDLPPEVIK